MHPSSGCAELILQNIVALGATPAKLLLSPAKYNSACYLDVVPFDLTVIRLVLLIDGKYHFSDFKDKSLGEFLNKFGIFENVLV